MASASARAPAPAGAAAAMVSSRSRELNIKLKQEQEEWIAEQVEQENQEAERLALIESQKINLNTVDTQSEIATSSSFQYTDKKVGRNEPCPCGSGKKYKKCHGKL
jgi:preprotein translocase subunit SecA